MITVNVAGRLGDDAERKTVKEKRVLAFSVASNRGKDETTWISCSWWSPPEKIAEYLKKGQGVALVGELRITKKEERTFLDVDVLRLELVGPAPKKGESDSW